MSLVHWDKSVVTFHLKEIIEDHKAGDSAALTGLGAILLGTTIFPLAIKFSRPMLKSIIKSGIYFYQGTKASVDLAKVKSMPRSQANYAQSSNQTNHYNGQVKNLRESVK